MIGRDNDALRIARHFTTGSTRLLTITGPGGVGKTRLAIHVATMLAETMSVEPVWVPLAAVPSPDLVLPTILQRLDVHETSDLPAADRLLETVQDRHLLLVLDNLEHVVACAPDLGMVAASTSTRILVTSQVPLGVNGEQVFPLAPLAIPDPDAPPDVLMQSDAVSLFIQRAHAVNPLLDLSVSMARAIARICTHLDGLPLAIELAAARSNVLDPASLLARLDCRLPILTSDRRDLPARLRTLRNAIAWSYDLLTPDERRVFRWLSIFAGGIPLAAVDALPLDPAALASRLDLLAQLVNHSLVRVTMTPGQPPRYVMLETLREFGHEQLRSCGDDREARLWHAEWLARFTREARAHIHDVRQAETYDILQREWENIRLALDWFLSDEGEAGQALAMCGDLWHFWSTRGMASEGRRWIDRALAATPDTPTPQRARALLGSGHLAADQNELDRGERQMLAALAIAEDVDDKEAMASILAGLGAIANDRSDYGQGVAWLRQALVAADASGDRRARLVAMSNLGVAHYFLGEYAFARAAWEESAAAARAIGDLQGEALLLGNLGALLLDLDEFESAREVLERSLELQRALDDIRAIGFSLTNLAEARFRLDDLETPIALLEEAIRSFHAYDNAHFAAIAQILWARIQVARGDLRDGLARYRDVLITLGECHDFAYIAEAAELLACAAVHINAMEDARALLVGAAILRDQAETPGRPSIAHETNAARQAVLATLGPDALPAPSADDLTRNPDDIATEAIRIATALLRRATAPPAPEITGPMPSSVETLTASNHGSSTAPPRFGLSDREMEVLRLLADGKSTREIADELFIAPRTAATHVDHILSKLDVSSRTAAVALALRLGIV